MVDGAPEGDSDAVLDRPAVSARPAVTGKLALSEVFGPTIQGEGPHAGRVVQFIRLGGCNLSCSWCDTPYTWDNTRFDLRKENPQTAVDDIVARLRSCVPVVISGGEPLIHQKRPAWAELLSEVQNKCHEIHIETNGTILPNETTRMWVDHYSISPKLGNAGPHRKGQNRMMAEGWRGQWYRGMHTKCLKFVVAGTGDVDEALHLSDCYGWPRRDVWLMPEGIDSYTVMKRWPFLVEAAVASGVNASQRLHVLAWGNERGH